MERVNVVEFETAPSVTVTVMLDDPRALTLGFGSSVHEVPVPETVVPVINRVFVEETVTLPPQLMVLSTSEIVNAILGYVPLIILVWLAMAVIVGASLTALIVMLTPAYPEVTPFVVT